MVGLHRVFGPLLHSIMLKSALNSVGESSIFTDMFCAALALQSLVLLAANALQIYSWSVQI